MTGGFPRLRHPSQRIMLRKGFRSGVFGGSARFKDCPDLAPLSSATCIFSAGHNSIRKITTIQTVAWRHGQNTGNIVKKPRKAGKPEPASTAKVKRSAFVKEYLIDLNATAAYKRAGYKCTGHAAESAAHQLLRNIEVQKALQEAIAERAKRLEMKADDVLLRWAQIADADPNELIELRRTCCRSCHGTGFQYQRTRGEMKQAKANWKILAQQAKEAKASIEPFDPMGGEGYDARKMPHPDCPECFGEGEVVPFPKDTRYLSESARRLYAGLKVTKDGIEIKTRDQDAALLNVAKHLGMFVTKVEHSGANGGAIPIEIVGVEIVAPKGPHDSAV